MADREAFHFHLPPPGFPVEDSALVLAVQSRDQMTGTASVALRNIETLVALNSSSQNRSTSSPPYWGLRNYRTEPQVWGGDPECEHEWDTRRYYVEGGGVAAQLFFRLLPCPFLGILGAYRRHVRGFCTGKARQGEAEEVWVGKLSE